MAERIIFRMAAWTDAAGKYNPDAPLDGNEDNYYADDDLSDDTPSHVIADEDIALSDCGMLMAVADGMGGMNAGEVASQIAHDTVADFFAPGKITPQLAETHTSRSRYMENVIHEADRRIKSESNHNQEHEGMGSTLILAWLVGNELSVTWIGDSRAYRYNPRSGIEPLSKDHSYVQELADKGIITYEQTFDHPQGNVITRSLGDESKKAKPDSRLFKVYDGDIILLCSDGLSGVLRDRKAYDENGELYPGENIEDIIREHSSSLKECREALWAAAERADWYDNVTAILCEIRTGAGEYVPDARNAESGEMSRSIKNQINKTFDGFVIKIPRKRFLSFLILLVIMIVLIGGGIWYSQQIHTPKDKEDTSDSIRTVQPTDTGHQMKKKKHPAEMDEEQTVTDDKTRKTKQKAATNPSSASPSKPAENAIPIDGFIKAAKQKKDSLTMIAPTDKLTPVK